MKHIAVYVRVSTDQQTTRSQDAELKKWAEGQDGEIVWYRDKATGTNQDRPGFQKLLSAIQGGEVSKVLVWRLDRLGRNAKGLLTFLEEVLAPNKVGFTSLKENLDLGTPAGRMMVTLLAAVAQFETEVRSERQRAGIEAARAEGKRWGGRKPGTRITVTPEKLNAVKAMAEDKKSISEISRVTGLSRQTVYRILGLWERKPKAEGE